MSHRGDHEHRVTSDAFVAASNTRSDPRALRDLNLRGGGLFLSLLVVGFATTLIFGGTLPF